MGSVRHMPSCRMKARPPWQWTHSAHPASLNGTIPWVPKTEPENEKDPDDHKGGK